MVEEKKGEAKSLTELYKQLESESLSRVTTGKTGKSAVVREKVMELFKQTGKNRILMAAAYQAIKQALVDQGIQLDRTQFSGIVKRSFKCEKDPETGRIWVMKP